MSISKIELNPLYKLLSEEEKDEARGLVYDDMIARMMELNREKGTNIRPDHIVTAARVAIGVDKNLKNYNIYRRVRKALYDR